MRSWVLATLLFCGACQHHSTSEPAGQREQAMEPERVQLTSVDLAAGTFEGGTELSTGRLVTSPPANSVRSTSSASRLDVPRSGHAGAIARGFVYVFGGEGPLATTARAPLGTTGVGAFVAERPLPRPRAGAAATATGGFVFVLGGSASSEVWSAAVAADGSLGAWQATTPLPGPLEGLGAVASRKALYVIGGATSAGPVAEVWRAEVSATGAASAWRRETPLPGPRVGAAAVLHGNRLFVLGGSSQLQSSRVDSNEVLTAELDASGRVGPWRSLAPLPQARTAVNTVATRNALVVLGGLGASRQGEVWFAPMLNGGALAPWTVAATRAADRGGGVALAGGRQVVWLGGRNASGAATDEVLTFEADDGALATTWTVRATLAAPVSGAAVITARASLIVAGGRIGGVPTTTVTRSSRAGTGAVSTTALPALPVALADATGLFRDGVLYVIGGRDGAGVVRDEVYGAPMNEDGTVGPWTVRSRLPQGRARAGAALVNDRLVVVGGEDSMPRSDAFQAAFLADGTLGPWTNAGALPSPATGVAVVSRGAQVLVVGGASAAVLSASWLPSGQLSAFQQASSLPGPVGGAAVVTHGGDLVVVGGDLGAMASAQVLTASWTPDGRVGAFQPGGALPSARSGHGAGVIGNELFVIGGADPNVLSSPLSLVAGIGAFVPSPAVPSPRRAARLVSTERHVYLTGGSATGTGLPEVLVATRQPDDSLGPWVPSTPMPDGRFLHVLVLHRQRLYVIGGTIMGTPTADALTAPLLDDGGVGDWTPTTPLPDPRNEAVAVAFGDSVYVLGGQNGAATADVQVATALPDGGLSAWRPGPPLPRSRWGHVAVVAAGQLIVLGGTPDDVTSNEAVLEVTASELLTDGGLGAWRTIGAMTMSRRNVAAVTVPGAVLAIGGVERTGGSRLDDVEAAPLLEDGSLGPFMTVARFPGARRHPVAAVLGDRLLLGTGVGPPIQTVLADLSLAPLTAPRVQGAWSTVVDLGPESRRIDSVTVRLASGLRGHARLEVAIAEADGGFGPAVVMDPVRADEPLPIAQPGRWVRLSLELDGAEGFARQVNGGSLVVSALEVLGTVEVPPGAGVPTDGGVDGGMDPVGTADSGVDGGPTAPRQFRVGCGCGIVDVPVVLGLALVVLVRRRPRRASTEDGCSTR
jgi:N-acetylneuraminic acid mutarotase